MKKAVTTILLLIALLFGFAACGGAYLDPNGGDNGMGGYGGGVGGVGGGVGGGYGGGSGGAGGGGTLTITGIPQEHEGKYVFGAFGAQVGGGIGQGGYVDIDVALAGGFQSCTPTTITLSRISNGRVVLPLWDMLKANSKGFARWSGTGTAFVGIHVVDTQTVTVQQLMSLMTGSLTNAQAFEEVSFKRGSASISWSEGEWHN
jgi:hypothetical protein